MKTTVDIPDDLLLAVQKASNTRTKKDAITVALREYLRVRRSADLTELLGTFEEFMDRPELDAQRSEG